MRRILSIAFVSSLVALTAACTASSGQGDDDLGSADQEVKKADPLFGTICRACGCSMVTRTIDGCQVTRCECTSTKDAECVVNSPGSPSAVVVQPPRWDVPPIGTVVFQAAP